MRILSVFLFFASMTCLLVGLKKPTIFSYFFRGEVTRKKIASIFAVAIYTFFVLVVITDPSVGKDWPYLLFSNVFVTCIACLLAGLIKPTIFSYFFGSNPTRKKVAFIFGFATVVFLVLAVLFAPKTNNNKIDKKTIDDQVTVNTDYRNSVLSCFYAVQDQKTKTRHSDRTLEKRYRTFVSTPASPMAYAASRLDPPIVT